MSPPGPAGPEGLGDPPLLCAQTAGVPAPVPSLASEPYWEGCRAHQVRYQQCRSCGAIPSLPTVVCPRCYHSVLEWKTSGGNGALYSWTVVWRPQHPAFSIPYAPSVVRLDEGFYLMTAMVGCSTDQLCPELAVAAEFHRVDDQITLPFFHPA